jgi:hypothetical protein
MKTIFRHEDARPAGHVFRIPRKVRHIRDNKPSRPFLLLTRCSGFQLATLALMTTKSTESEYGGTLHEFGRERGRSSLPGQERSYVDLCSLMFRRADHLHESERSHARQMNAVRLHLREALGIGQGIGPGTPGDSIRGHLVKLANVIAELYEFEYGIVLTNHTYSAARRLQVIVPVVDVQAFLGDGETGDRFVPETWDVVPASTSSWIAQLPAGWLFPVIDTVRIASFTERWEAGSRPDTWLEEQIERVLPVPVDDATLTKIESAVASRLQLAS